LIVENAMTTRRDFLTTSLRGLPLISLAPTVPGFLAQTARAVEPGRDRRVLVVIQLDGGNDGINTVVPFHDEGYAKHRKVLRLPANELIKVGDGLGLHPALRNAAKLLELGRLAIVQGVGYPNPNRSHFQSMAIWQTARFDPEDHAGLGWLGRGFDAAARPKTSVSGPSSIFVGPGAAPVALRGRSTATATLERLEDFALDSAPRAKHGAGLDAARNDLAAFVSRSTLDAYATAGRLSELAHPRDSGTSYAGSVLGRRLELVSRLIKGDVGARVFYTSQSGYDTHAGQLPSHDGLLRELSVALEAFLDDIAASGLAERVVVLCFSEFGRRVSENDSGGTDHGTAGPVFVAGAGVNAGLFGKVPSLTDLDEGDLKMSIDFRRVYSSILSQWLTLPTQNALNGSFDVLPLVQG
jgi:uncharacterized protein (DUF1501 family)